MSKWLDRLREHEKNRRMQGNETLKTFETPETEVSRVLKVHSRQESEIFSHSPDDAQVAFDERAGILEYDCGLPRDEAERLARIQISNTLH